MPKQTWRKKVQNSNGTRARNTKPKPKKKTETKQKYAKGNEEKKYLKSSQANIYNSKSLWR